MFFRRRRTEAREQVRMLRVQLRSLLGDQARSLILASPHASREKSQLVRRLAETLAEEGRKVLLVEADPLGPAIGRAPGEHGPEATPDEHPEEPKPRPYRGFECVWLDPDLCADGVRMPLARWVSLYDDVLVNGPPLLEVGQAAVLAACAQATLLVIEVGTVATRDLERTRSLLERAGASLVGSVLVNVRRSA